MFKAATIDISPIKRASNDKVKTMRSSAVTSLICSSAQIYGALNWDFSSMFSRQPTLWLSLLTGWQIPLGRCISRSVERQKKQIREDLSSCQDRSVSFTALSGVTGSVQEVLSRTVVIKNTPTSVGYLLVPAKFSGSEQTCFYVKMLQNVKNEMHKQQQRNWLHVCGKGIHKYKQQTGRAKNHYSALKRGKTRRKEL